MGWGWGDEWGGVGNGAAITRSGATLFPGWANLDAEPRVVGLCLCRCVFCLHVVCAWGVVGEEGGCLDAACAGVVLFACAGVFFPHVASL